MGKLYDLIQSIALRPEIYIGKPSLERLYAYLSGYMYQNSDNNDHCLDGFNAYIAQKYNICSDHNWAEIIQFFSYSECDAFNTFIKHFSDFTANPIIKPSKQQAERDSLSEH